MKQIEQELKTKEEIKQAIDEYEDSLVEYSNMLKFDQDKHEKNLQSMKDLNDSYVKIIENERPSISDTNPNNLLKLELNRLIEERNNLLGQITKLETEDKLSEEKEENELKQHIKYLTNQLRLINY